MQKIAINSAFFPLPVWIGSSCELGNWLYPAMASLVSPLRNQFSSHLFLSLSSFSFSHLGDRQMLVNRTVNKWITHLLITRKQDYIHKQQSLKNQQEMNTVNRNNIIVITYIPVFCHRGLILELSRMEREIDSL